jgi:GxxExxY protein
MKQEDSHGGGEAGRSKRRVADALSTRVIGLAIEVHRYLGPGLLESAYEACLCHEFQEQGIGFARQVALPVSYKGHRLDCGYRIDIIVESRLLLEIKSVERLLPLHEAQLLTYIRLANLPSGLLMNFNTAVLKDGLRRMTNSPITPLPLASPRLPASM